MLSKDTLCKWLHQVSQQLYYQCDCSDTVKKQESLVEISMLTQWKMKIEMWISIIIEDTINIESKSISVQILLDIDAEVNVISQHFMMQIRMKSLNSKLSHSVLLNEQHHYCYSTYLVTYQLKDSWDQKHNCEHIFYALDKNEFKLVLDLLTLEKKQIKIDCEMWEWCFEIKLQSLSLKESSEDFEQSLRKESMICALLWVQSVFISVHLQDIKLTLTISVSYSDYADVFLKKEVSWLSAHEKHDHTIEINEKEPSYKSLYNLFKTELNVLRKYLDNILEKSWIKHSVNSVSVSVLFVLKKNEDLRLYVNYWDLNCITIKNWHSLSLISEILDQLSETKIFIKLDLKNAYHCIWIWHDDEWKTVFHTCYDHFKYMIMLFKLINASVIFQIYINWVFVSIVNSLCVVYLNDILIYSHDKEKHEHHVHKVLEWLHKFKLYINLKKCAFFTNNMKFLRFIVLTDSVMMNSQRVETIEYWSILRSFYEIQIFLEFANFYWWFIEAYSWIASSLISLLKENKNRKKTESFLWSDDAEKMFSRLKEVFITVSVLVHFNSELKSQIETDVSE